MPLVSIIMNCLNGERFLRQAIDSIYDQTHQDFEIIFFDNASTDGSAEIALAYDHRLKYHRADKVMSLGKARGEALSMAEGEWIAFLDVDDYWYPNKTARQLEVLQDTDHVLCYSGILEKSYEGELIRKVFPKYRSGNQFPEQLSQFDINMVTAMVRRSALDLNDLSFDPTIIASEEYDLFVRLSTKGTFCSVPEILGVWRIGKDTLTNKAIEFWWKDRSLTLDNLLKENPLILEEYGRYIFLARARCMYYRACWHMSLGDQLRARSFLKEAALISPIYWFLFFASFSEKFWRFIHLDKIKRRVSSWLGYAGSK